MRWVFRFRFGGGGGGLLRLTLSSFVSFVNSSGGGGGRLLMFMILLYFCRFSYSGEFWSFGIVLFWFFILDIFEESFVFLLRFGGGGGIVFFKGVLLGLIILGLCLWGVISFWGVILFVSVVVVLVVLLSFCMLELLCFSLFGLGSVWGGIFLFLVLERLDNFFKNGNDFLLFFVFGDIGWVLGLGGGGG